MSCNSGATVRKGLKKNALVCVVDKFMAKGQISQAFLATHVDVCNIQFINRWQTVVLVIKM